MHFEATLSDHVKAAVSNIFGKDLEPGQLTFQPTRKDFEGDLTLVVFPLAKITGQSPEKAGQAIGTYLTAHCSLVKSFNQVKGFLNITIYEKEWLHQFGEALHTKSFGFRPAAAGLAPVLVEYSSPNTNKPLHLGHVRNNLIGYSIARILKANGNQVIKVNLVNDRGIHICKSMLAWQKLGNGETPSTTGIKGDHLVGKYYVLFDQEFRKEVENLVASGLSREEAEKKTGILKEAQDMLRKWEAGDQEVVDLWKRMNGWVYEGFDITYRQLGVDFDKFYYESETYLLGKKIIEKGLKAGVFFQKPDGSVWVDLTQEGLDHKLLLRSDGTSVYMTQDLGTAELRFQEFGFRKLIYVVANEQDYHFNVLKKIIRKLDYPWWDHLFHLSYGMVDLPGGKMKSREGTVVDADELMDEMEQTARKLTLELGKIEGFSEEDATHLFRVIGLGALKYFILKVDPDKKMLFNPVESIDFNGNTGPFIQYTHARIRSVLRKADRSALLSSYMTAGESSPEILHSKEKELIKLLLRFPEIVEEAGHKLSPALIANFIYELVRSFNQFYHENPIVDETQAPLSILRLRISCLCADVIQSGMYLLGIEVPDRM